MSSSSSDSSLASSSDANNTTTTTTIQKFDYFLVLDFEASCDDKIKNFRNEIIEFPTVAINAKTLQIDHEFHYYVKPKANPILTDFCKELTGIQQEWIENGVEFEEVLKLHNQWMMDNFISKNLTFAFVTCGDWDLKTMITKQCRKEDIKVPSYFEYLDRPDPEPREVLSHMAKPEPSQQSSIT